MVEAWSRGLAKVLLVFRVIFDSSENLWSFYTKSGSFTTAHLSASLIFIESSVNTFFS